MRPHLSPLNFSGLIATLHLGGEPTPREPAKLEAEICYRCPDCMAIYTWEEYAIECCEESVAENAPGNALMCPVCAEEYSEYGYAVDCCLWKDLDAPARWRIAAAMESGSTWSEQLGLEAA